MGILFAFIALFSWGFGDFFIQKSTRKFGDWIALFYITALPAVALFPAVYRQIIPLFESNLPNLALLIGMSCIMLFAGLLEFEAFRVGKIAVIESVNAFEVLVTVVLATFILEEYLRLEQSLLILLLIIGIFLVSLKSFHQVKNVMVEKGVRYAILATVGMGATNFLVGVGSRQTSPLLVNWFTSAFIAMIALVYLLSQSRFKDVFYYWRTNKKLIVSMTAVDTLAWVAFAYSTLFIPIAIATSISESYIALAALLGILVNKEKLKPNQWVGLALCIVTAIILAAITHT